MTSKAAATAAKRTSASVKPAGFRRRRCPPYYPDGSQKLSIQWIYNGLPWLVVSTNLKKYSSNWVHLPQVGLKIQNLWNHRLVYVVIPIYSCVGFVPLIYPKQPRSLFFIAQFEYEHFLPHKVKYRASSHSDTPKKHFGKLDHLAPPLSTLTNTLWKFSKKSTTKNGTLSSWRKMIFLFS